MLKQKKKGKSKLQKIPVKKGLKLNAQPDILVYAF